MARLMALDVAEPGGLTPFEVPHLGGHWLPRGIGQPQVAGTDQQEPHTPLDDAVRASLLEMGACEP
jgi:hypothetical protein